jgi:hypothetical protein
VLERRGRAVVGRGGVGLVGFKEVEGRTCVVRAIGGGAELKGI